MSDADTQATLTGQVIYRERMMPRPGSTLTVTLEDVSRADAPSEVLGIFETTLEGGPPYEFRIEYDPASIDERMRYNLRARIERDGR
ncbi:MAG: YbaY family lipoprotein, partial [Gemmatimonadota bacterium]